VLCTMHCRYTQAEPAATVAAAAVASQPNTAGNCCWWWFFYAVESSFCVLQYCTCVCVGVRSPKNKNKTKKIFFFWGGMAETLDQSGSTPRGRCLHLGIMPLYLVWRVPFSGESIHL
jgi:hypothetical protein